MNRLRLVQSVVCNNQIAPPASEMFQEAKIIIILGSRLEGLYQFHVKKSVLCSWRINEASWEIGVGWLICARNPTHTYLQSQEYYQGSDRILIARSLDAGKSQRLMLSICCSAYPFWARSVPVLANASLNHKRGVSKVTHFRLLPHEPKRKNISRSKRLKKGHRKLRIAKRIKER